MLMEPPDSHVLCPLAGQAPLAENKDIASRFLRVVRREAVRAAGRVLPLPVELSVPFNPSVPPPCLLVCLLSHLKKAGRKKMERVPACLLHETKSVKVPTYTWSVYPSFPVIKTSLVRGPPPQTSPPPQADHRPSSQKGLDWNLDLVICHSCTNLKEDV